MKDAFCEDVRVEDSLPRTVFLITSADGLHCIGFPDKDVRDSVFSMFPSFYDPLVPGGMISINRSRYPKGKTNETNP